MDSWEKCEMDKLSPKQEFYSILNECGITDEDYEHAQNVWEEFKIRNMGKYSDIYVKTDVLILAEIFQKFRDVCMKTYILDPAWCFTAPGLSWDATLKMTDIHFKFDKYGKANNKYMKDYDKNKESNYLMYLDANNFYAWAMSQYLPYGGFECEKGYIIEVDLEYHKKLHDYHSDLPLAPENRIPDRSKQSKLLTTLYDKKKYVIHYRNLKQYLKMGMKLKKIHRVLEFKQSDWLKKYIDLNTEIRTKATNDFEKDFFKLMHNSVFGKTMENTRNRIGIRLCCDVKKVEKLIATPNFKHRTIFTENLCAIHMYKTKIVFNKPLYDFHYNVMKPKYRDNIKLLYQDTDSYIYNLKTDDFYQDMKGMKGYFDTSDYPENNQYDILRVNKKVLGKMKDENNGKIMRDFVGLRAKMYPLKVDDQVTKKSKGVKKCVVKNL
ncbi:uncharacterized protein LOC111640701 [Centruroides sculpturatus]|uniref:uncharacterized protein LOC111640701 n=1 Tax=Centruroides sculpturatus TaxID=218467 RepID=UPI000C6CC4AB|nr:uncharacterized protein LOC111640701 [Centruroides sculpturatus]